MKEKMKNSVVTMDAPAELGKTSAGVDSMGKTGVFRRGRGRVPTLTERLAPVIGKARGLPADLAAHHDCYLYGSATV